MSVTIALRIVKIALYVYGGNDYDKGRKVIVIMEDNKCKDCINDKGCINCEDGNMHEVKKKKPEGALKELLDNIDPIEYEKVRQEMLKEAVCDDLEKAVQAYSNLYNDECFDAIGNECPYIKNAFKAGAEWMAKQGETLYDYINVDGKNQRWLGENLLQGDYDAGQAVIVQIRKV